ncbi:Hint domain-containing protein [Loktanella sp. IMCC34160]|uniref:Hint domain-containing protein n=1 Tax=Loktanella sp. IMCC34160 TaxID=2510646 RepID=UPI00101CD8A0|nr:Hint domain-containing protein [Loktanella sp. IMCC34160]RYG90661.1 Hint domain-containing protein [Loktanella sp. IMCC34160]
MTGDEIGFFSSVSVSGSSNGTKVTLDGGGSLGSATDVFRIVVEDVVDGVTGFVTGQTISVYAYPPTSDPEVPLYSDYTINTDDYNGRATSADHLIIEGDDGTALVIDLDGVTSPSHQIGPGIDPGRYQEFQFSSLPSTPPTFPCFARGTLIETDMGPLPIETLKAGDLVKTMDDGLMPILWIGSSTVPGYGAMAPITIEAGALGNYRRLRVSPQHRMLVRDWQAELLFGDPQVLAAAKHLVNGRTIRETPCPKVTYFHMILDGHQVIYAEGCPAESLHLGSEAIEMMSDEARAEIAALFPELNAADTPTARPCLKSYEGALISPLRKTGVRSAAA